MHPMIVAELGLGSLRRRAETLAELDGLLEVKVAQMSEVRQMIESTGFTQRESVSRTRTL